MARINLSRKRLEDYVDITEFNSDNEKIEDHTSKTATSRSSGHVKLSDTANEEQGKNSGIAVTPKALHDATSGVTEKVDKISKDYAEHEKLEGTYQVAGHVKLSNAVNSQSSVSDGVAATPKAVKEVNDNIITHKDKRATKEVAGHVKLSDDYQGSTSGENDGVALTPSAGFKLFNQVVNEVMLHENKLGGKNSSGHVGLSDDVDDDRDVNRFTAATPKAVKTVNDRINNLNKSDVGLGNVDNVKQATKNEFDTHANYIGNFGAPGHVRLSNHTTSESSVSHGVAATPLAVKTVNDRIDNLESGDINITNPKDSDAPFTDYPLGVSVFYTNAGDSGYPNRIVTVMTVRDDDRTAFQFAARNGYADVSKHMWYRIGHYQTGWSEWYRIADNRDISEVKELAEKAQKTADEALTLGDKQRDKLAGSLSSKGVDLPSNPSWERLQSEVGELKSVKVAHVNISRGQTSVRVGFDIDLVTAGHYDIDESVVAVGSNVFWGEYIFYFDGFDQIGIIKYTVSGNKITFDGTDDILISIPLVIYGGLT